MKLTAHEELGLRCLVQIARQGPDAQMTIADLARLEGMSGPNVAKVMRVLRSHGFVTSIRGQQGGYQLAKPAGEINIGDAMVALGGRLYDPSFCERHSGEAASCSNDSDCSIRSVWRLVQTAVDEVLGRLTLEQLVGREGDVALARRGRHIPLQVIAADA